MLLRQPSRKQKAPVRVFFLRDRDRYYQVRMPIIYANDVVSRVRSKTRLLSYKNKTNAAHKPVPCGMYVQLELLGISLFSFPGRSCHLVDYDASYRNRWA